MGSYMWKMRLLRLLEDVEGVVAVEACDDDEEVAGGAVDDDEDDGFDVEQLEEVVGSIEPEHGDGKEWSL